MGNSPSSPTIVEDEPPAGSEESSIVYPSRTTGPRLTGLTRSMANNCDFSLCTLEVVPEISTSSVRLTREFGSISAKQCRTYYTDKKRLDSEQMSTRDFLTKLSNGEYFMAIGRGDFCKQIELSPEDLAKAQTDGYDESKVRTVRIQKVESGGFSASTKARFTPAIPFKLVFGGKEVTITTMTLYHPCPLRIEDIQADAVLSLNDPSFGNPNTVVLVPLVGRNTNDLSVKFLSKLAAQISAVATVNPATGEYTPHTIATGANWSLSKLFGISDRKGGSVTVPNGYYIWSGIPPLGRKQTVNSWPPPPTIRYSWEPTGQGAPVYITLDTPVAIGSGDLATILRNLPATPPLDAIHAVLHDSSNPLNRGIYHKPGPPISAEDCSKNALYREMFGNEDLNGVTNDTCDPWDTWANTNQKGYTNDEVFTLLFNVAVVIAATIGAYMAITSVGKYYDDDLKGLAELIGKVAAVFTKNVGERATSGAKNTFALFQAPAIQIPQTRS